MAHSASSYESFQVGFENVVVDDKTEEFVYILNAELEEFNKRKDNFLELFEEHDFDYIVSGWKAKLERCRSGDQAWGLFTARKPF